MSAVRSVEPLSTTITWSTKAGMRLSTRSMPCSSLRHGMMTVTLRSLYMLYDEGYHEISRHPIMRHCARSGARLLRRGSPRGRVRLPAADVQRSGSVPGQSAGRLRPFRVVADPKQAQAIFTERLGEAFEERLKTLLAPAEPKPATENKADETAVPRISPFGRGKGTIFLVDAGTRTVLWSTYEKPRNSSPQEQDRSAQRIVDRLKASLKRK